MTNRRSIGVGAESLDRDVYTWSHSHYLMRQCNGVGGWGKVRRERAMSSEDRYDDLTIKKNGQQWPHNKSKNRRDGLIMIMMRPMMNNDD